MKARTSKAGLSGATLPLTPVAATSDGLERKDVADMLDAVMDSDRTVYTKMVIQRLIVTEKVLIASEFFEDHIAALLCTLEKGLGDDWNDELKTAWTET